MREVLLVVLIAVVLAGACGGTSFSACDGSSAPSDPCALYTSTAASLGSNVSACSFQTPYSDVMMLQPSCRTLACAACRCDQKHDGSIWKTATCQP